MHNSRPLFQKTIYIYTYVVLTIQEEKREREREARETEHIAKQATCPRSSQCPCSDHSVRTPVEKKPWPKPCTNQSHRHRAQQTKPSKQHRNGMPRTSVVQKRAVLAKIPYRLVYDRCDRRPPDLGAPLARCPGRHSSPKTAPASSPWR